MLLIFLWPCIHRPGTDIEEEEIEKTGRGYGIAGGGDYVNWNSQDLDNEFKLAKSLGVTQIRIDIDWEIIQPYNSSHYDWAATDKVVTAARNNGLEVVGLITYSPQWAHPNFECESWEHFLPDDPKTYGTFCGEAAKHYRGQIKAYEIWNEPNIPIFSAPKSDPEKYANCLIAAYKEIKKTDPGAIVLTGGLARTLDDRDSHSPATFLREIYEHGGKDYFDAAAIHPYNYPECGNWTQAEAVRSVMVEKGDGAKKIWFTEYGAPTCGNPRENYVSEEKQKEMILNMLSYRDNNPWVGEVFVYCLRDNAPKGAEYSSKEDFFGIIALNGSEKPVCRFLPQRQK